MQKRISDISSIDSANSNWRAQTLERRLEYSRERRREREVIVEMIWVQEGQGD